MMVRQGLRQKVSSSGYVKGSIMWSYLVHFSVQAPKNKKNIARDNFLYPWENGTF